MWNCLFRSLVRYVVTTGCLLCSYCFILLVMDEDQLHEVSFASVERIELIFSAVMQSYGWKSVCALIYREESFVLHKWMSYLLNLLHSEEVLLTDFALHFIYMILPHSWIVMWCFSLRCSWSYVAVIMALPAVLTVVWKQWLGLEKTSLLAFSIQTHIHSKITAHLESIHIYMSHARTHVF